MQKMKNGFTLIELMITIAILGTLTVLTSQTIQQSIKSKVKLQTQIDDVSRMRDAMRLMERDVNLIFHYRDIEKELYDLMKKPTTGTSQQQQQPPLPNTNPSASMGAYDPFLPTREMPRKDPVTQFVGTNETMNFVTSNNARTVKGLQQADFVEVGYALKDCKSLKAEGGTSKCLWRRSSALVDDDVTKGGDEMVLLENVSEFTLRYIGKGKQDWVKEWRTDDAGDGITKGNFPDAVEISLAVEKKVNGKAKKYSMQNIIPLHFVNNTNTTTPPGATSGTPTTTPPTTSPATSKGP